MKKFILERASIYISIILTLLLICFYDRIHDNLEVKLLLIVWILISYIIVILNSMKIERHKRYIDGLTNAFTKEKLFKDMEKRLKARRKFNTVYIDLDDFKKINDTKGHLFGDTYLKKFNILLSSCGYDYIYRYGGDEFVIITNEEYENITKDLNDIINNNKINFSFGVVCYDEFIENDIELKRIVNKILKKADEKMYENKSNKIKRA